MLLTDQFRVLKKKWWVVLLTTPVWGLLIYLYWPLNGPVIDKPYATVLLDRSGQLMGAILADDEIWRFPTADSVPERFKQALIYYEDQYFYRHPGINPLAIARAAVQNWKAKKVVSGGSTLSMQVARMAKGNQARSWYQKIKETLLAIRLERKLSKEEIIKLYVTHAPFGSNIEGLTAASWRYFGRAPEVLSWGEAATLAVLPNQPGMIYPGKNSAQLKSKRDFILRKLHANSLMDDTSLHLALLEELPEKQYLFPKISQHLLHHMHQSGYEGKMIHSSLNSYWQKQIYEMAHAYARNLATNQIHNLAALVIDWQTEEVMAYIGNASFGAEAHKDVDIVRALRSPGSSIKPFLYAKAIERGLISPWQLLADIPIFFEGFSPKNFDHNYYGAVAADKALARSLNIPFVNLLRDYGYERFHFEMKKAGWKSLNKTADHYGLSLILGGAEISLWELANMYTKLARSAQQSDSREEVIIAYDGNNTPINSSKEGMIEPAAAWLSLRAMQEVLRPEEEAGWQYFTDMQQISWKTGTSYGFRDGWAIGINQRYVVAVWAGNAEGEGRPGLLGAQAAAPFMFQLFRLIQGGGQNIPMPVQQMETKTYCKRSGYLAGQYCEEKELRYNTKAGALLKLCPYHHRIFLNKAGNRQVNSDCYAVADMQPANAFVLPPAMARFYKKYNAHYQSSPEWATGCQSLKRGSMEMIYPRNSTQLLIPRQLQGDKGSAVFEVAHEQQQARIFWYLDDNYLGSTQGSHQMEINSKQAGEHYLFLSDENGAYLEFTFTIIDK